MMAIKIGVNNTDVCYEIETKNANRQEAMLIVAEMERRKLELLDSIDDDDNIDIVDYGEHDGERL